MRSITWLLLIGLMGLWGSAGCQDKSPPPPRMPVPADREPGAMQREPAKPLPPPRQSELPPPPFEDVPLVTQVPPEQPAFVDAYRRVGAPRICLFVNRTLEGSIVPVNPNDPLLSVERTRRSSAGVTVETRDVETRQRRWHADTARSSERFESKGPAEYRDTVDVYLRPGQYDEVAAKSIDYEAIENIMTDWLACNGQVTVISPIMARQRLSDQQVKELQEGRPQVLSEVAQQLGTDILVQVQARPTRQTREGLEVRIIAEALNIKGGQSVGRAMVDVPPPLEKTTINRYTRFLARKLMADITGTWMAPPPPRPPEPQAQPAPPPEPPAQPAPPSAPPTQRTPSWLPVPRTPPSTQP